MQKKHLFISSVVASLALAAAAQADTIAHWNFNANAGSIPEYAAPLASDSGSGSLDWDFTSGTNGVASFAGTTTNIVGADASGNAFCPQGDGASASLDNNGKGWTISLDTTGYAGIIVSFAQRGTASGFSTMTIEYSSDGSTFTPVVGSPYSMNQTSTWNTQSFDLSSITAVDENANFKFRITVDGATGATGNTRMDNLRIDGTPTSGPITPAFTAYSSAADKLIVDFSQAPTVAVVPGDFSFGGTETPTVSSVSNVSGDIYELTLSGAASGDLTVDTLTYDNTTDNSATADVYAGIVSLSTLRAAVIADTNYNPSFAAGYMSVQGTVIENVFDAGAADNVTIQQGSAGILIRDASATDLPASVSVGDEIIFVGNYTAYNGLQEIVAGPGMISTVSTSNPVPSPVVLTSSSTAADCEAAESTMVTIQNVTFTNGGSALGLSGSGTNQTFVETALIASRFDGDLTAEFGTYNLPTGAQDVSGILGQYVGTDPRNTGYQVFPLTQSDIVANSAVSDWMILN